MFDSPLFTKWFVKRVPRPQRQRQRRPLAEIPAHINFAATAEDWRVRREATDSKQVRIAETRHGELRVKGAVANDGDVLRALKRWLARRAKSHLVGQLDELSARHGFSYARATIRFQRSRWGSCSSRGTISLNARLMFLPPDLVRCVLAHELCHTAHLNHGPHFWSLLDQVEPAHRALHHELREGSRHIPRWALT